MQWLESRYLDLWHDGNCLDIARGYDNFGQSGECCSSFSVDNMCTYGDTVYISQV